MAVSPAKSVIVVGGGIVGLTVALAAQARGQSVTLLDRGDCGRASYVAAGMISPALEAMQEADPKLSFERLKSAQSCWLELLDCWPSNLATAIAETWTSLPSHYLLSADPDEAEAERQKLMATGASYLLVDNMRPGRSGAIISGDWLASSVCTCLDLRNGFEKAGGRYMTVEAEAVSATTVTLLDGREMHADAITVAGGFESRRLARFIPTLAHLSAIKGQLLEAHNLGDGIMPGIVRSAMGYLARTKSNAKFGASSQLGRADLDEDQEITSELARKLQALKTDDFWLPMARVGIRAASPDGWPMIGRDRSSGVLVATAMRRNGYIFAPLAARMMLDFFAGKEPPEAALYDPNRFG